VLWPSLLGVLVCLGHCGTLLPDPGALLALGDLVALRGKVGDRA